MRGECNLVFSEVAAVSRSVAAAVAAVVGSWPRLDHSRASVLTLDEDKPCGASHAPDPSRGVTAVCCRLFNTGSMVVVGCQRTWCAAAHAATPP